MNILPFLFLFISVLAFPQNDTKAKIEYEDAETAFASGDFTKTLSHLEEAKKILKKENAKILYLQILAERELARKDTAYFSTVKKTIEKFEKSPGYKPFSEEKKGEIYKIYERLDSEKEAVVNEMKDTRNKESAFQNFSFKDWELDVNIDELKEKHKESKFFKARPKKPKKPHDYFGYHLFPMGKYGFDLTAVLLNDKDVVKGYMFTYDYSRYKGNVSISSIQQIYQPVIEEHTKKFGFKPQTDEKEKSIEYTWKKNGKTVVFQIWGLQDSTGKDAAFSAYNTAFVMIN